MKNQAKTHKKGSDHLQKSCPRQSKRIKIEAKNDDIIEPIADAEDNEKTYPEKSNQNQKDLYEEFKFYLCPESTCEARNNSIERFVHHIIENHPRDSKKILKLNVEDIEVLEVGNTSKTSKSISFQCNICSDKFSNKFLIRKHLFLNHKLEQHTDQHIIEKEVNETKVEFSDLELSSRQKLEEYSFYICPECDDIFQDKLSLIEHAFGYHPKLEQLHRKFIDIFRSKYDDGNVESRSSISLEKINTKKTIIENVEPVIDQPVPKNNIKHNHCQSESTDFVKQLCSQNPNDFAFESDKIKTEMENATEKGFKTEQKSSEVQNKKKVDIKDEQPEICSQTPNDFTSESDKIKTEMKNATKKGFKTEQKSSEAQNMKKEIKDEQPENDDPMNKIEPLILMNTTEESPTDSMSNRNKCSLDRLKCASCDQTFRTMFELKTHDANFHRKKGAIITVRPYVKCKICFKSFINFAYLNHHNLKKHDIYTCEICSGTCKTLQDLKKHWKSVHKIENKIDQVKLHLRANGIGANCDVCNMFFLTIHELDTHRRNGHYKSQQNQPKSKSMKTK